MQLTKTTTAAIVALALAPAGALAQDPPLSDYDTPPTSTTPATTTPAATTPTETTPAETAPEEETSGAADDTGGGSQDTAAETESTGSAGTAAPGTAAGQSSTPSALAYTGQDSSAWVLGGLGVAALGGVALVALRRRPD